MHDGTLGLTLALSPVVVAQQDGAAFTIGDPTAAPSATPTTGQPSGATPPPASPFGSMLPLLLLGVFVFFIFTMISGERKNKKKRAQMMSALKRHDRVQTVGGIIGVVTDIRDDEVTLRVDEASKTRIRFAKSAIQQVLTVSPLSEAEAKPSEATEPQHAGV